MTRQRNEKSEWADIREQNSVLWSTVSPKPKNFRKEVILSAWNDIKRHSASLYCYCCQYGNRRAGQLASFHKLRRGHFGARSRLTSVPCWPAGICVRLWFARKTLSISPSLFVLCSRSGLLCQEQTQSSYKASGKSLKPDLITSWSTAVVSDRVLDEIFPSSALTGPVKHWHSGKRMMKCRFVNTKIPWLYTSPVQMSHKYLSKFPM